MINPQSSKHRLKRRHRVSSHPRTGRDRARLLGVVDAWVVNNALVRFVAQPKPTAGLSKTRCDDVYNNPKKQKEARKEKKRRSKKKKPESLVDLLIPSWPGFEKRGNTANDGFPCRSQKGLQWNAMQPSLAFSSGLGLLCPETFFFLFLQKPFLLRSTVPRLEREKRRARVPPRHQGGP